MRSQLYKNKAEENHKIRKEKFAGEIQASLDASVIYGKCGADKYDLTEKRHEKTFTDIIGTTIMDYLIEKAGTFEGKTAVLNFASYNNPGGGYMKGMMAQEEAICHWSNLYEIISRKTDYYDWNVNHKNKGMYQDRLLYTPDVLVLDAENGILDMVDVITCAAPNNSLGIRYGNFSEEQCRGVFYNRMQFMMHIAAYNKVDNLILGAWGCGVFRNDPTFVAESLFKIQQVYDGYFDKVLYVIPKGDNYDTFLRVVASM